MRRFWAMFGNIKMTNAIAGLVLIAIIGSIVAVSGTIYVNLRAQALADSRLSQQSNLAVAATILERRISGSTVNWNEDGSIGAFQTWAIPPFYDTQIIDSVTRVTRGDASVYVLDPSTQELMLKTTSLIDASGSRVPEQPLSRSEPAYEAIMASTEYVGAATFAGVQYFGAFHPIVKNSGEVMGAIFVGTPLSQVEAAANSVLGLILMVGSAVTVVLAGLGFLLSRVITRPVPRIARAMEAIAEGDYQAEVPYLGRKNEVGAMARAVEVFRQNGLRVSQMTEAEAARIIADQQNRKLMMGELQAAFGQVVDAAVAGDFTRSVTTEFPDPELNALAGSVNNLASTFNRGVTDVGRVLGSLADTDLTERMEGHYEGAFATLKNDVNRVADKLTEVVGQLRHASGSLKTATGEILSGANDLSERTTRQAATIEETSAAMEQLASTVQQNAERATAASVNAGQVTRTAEEGGKVMDAATSAMERITASSAKISNIIGMIDDIAFQTNLLALNASVEAARAGDAGKGFAVVAVEVRRLAQSAAQASSDVKVLIEQSAGEVSAGSKLVGEAAGKLRNMLEAARSNDSLLSSIANESRDQAAAIEEVSSAVRTLDEMTQHNAALVEETNAAIEQTEAQASQLDLIVDTFHLRRDERSTQAGSAGRPREALGQPATPVKRAPRLVTSGNAAVAAEWQDF